MRQNVPQAQYHKAKISDKTQITNKLQEFNQNAHIAKGITF